MKNKLLVLMLFVGLLLSCSDHIKDGIVIDKYIVDGRYCIVIQGYNENINAQEQLTVQVEHEVYHKYNVSDFFRVR